MKIMNKIDNLVSLIKPYIKPFLIIFAIYLVALFTVIRANYSYMDDIGRSIHGYNWNGDFNRYSSTLLSYLLNMNNRLSDISPLPQLVAAAIMSIVSLIIGKLLSNRAGVPKFQILLSTTLIGLSPFMLGCWVFKFDAPCMALAILASVIPAALYRYRPKRWGCTIGFAVAFIATLVMWTSYQAASGILPTFILALIFMDVVVNRTKIMTVLRRALPILAGYIVSSGLFALTLSHANHTSYRQVGVYPVNKLLSGIIHNLSDMLHFIVSSMTQLWLVMLGIMLVLFVITAIMAGKSLRRRASFVLLAVLFIMIAIPLSYGSYLILQNAPSYYSRTYVGVSFLIGLIPAMTAAMVANRGRVIQNLCLVPAVLAGYAFIVYSFALGNALFDQRRFADTRLNQLSSDLNRVYGDDDISDKQIRIIGNIGMSPVMSHLQEQYPITQSISIDLQTGLNGLSVWGYRQLKEYYGWNMVEDTGNQLVCNKTVLNNHYFNIKQDGEQNVCVEIK